jgi:hypothetical protein
MTVENTKYSLSIDGVQNVVGGLNQVGGGFGKVDDRIRDTSGSIARFTALAGTMAVGTLTAMVKSSIDVADNLNDLSKSTNMSVEDLSGLRLLADQSGTSLESLGKAIGKLSVNMGKDAEKFAAVGITAKDPIEALKQLSDLFISIEDPNKRNAVANAALGKSWQELAPLLSEGGTRIGELVDKGRSLSGVTTEMAENADKFNDQLAEMKIRAEGAATLIAGPLVSSLNAAMDEMSEAIRLTGGFGDALMTFGFSSPFGTATEQVAKYREELDDIDAALVRYRRAGSDTRALDESRIKTLNQLRMAQFRQRQEIDYSAGNQNDAESKRLGLVSRTKSTPTGLEGFIGADDAAKKYDAAIKKSDDFIAQIRKETAEIGVSAEDKKKYEADQIAGIMRVSGVSAAAINNFLALSLKEAAALEQRQTTYKAIVDQEKIRAGIVNDLTAALDREAEADYTVGVMAKDYAESIEETNRLTELELSLMGRTAAERDIAIAHHKIDLDLQRQMLAIKKEMASDEATMAAIARATEAAGQAKSNAITVAFLDGQKKAAEASQKVWDNFTENVQRNLGDGLYQAMNGNFKGIGDAFKQMVMRMMADAAAANLMKALIGDASGGTNWGGLAGAIIGAFSGGMTVDTAGMGLTSGGSSLASYGLGAGRAGGGSVAANSIYPVNERGVELLSVRGRDFLMMGADSGQVTPNHKLGGQSIQLSYAPVITVDSRADRADVQAMVSREIQRGNAQLVDQLQRAGRI